MVRHGVTCIGYHTKCWSMRSEFPRATACGGRRIGVMLSKMLEMNDRGFSEVSLSQ